MQCSRQTTSLFSRWFIEPWRPIDDPMEARNCRLMSRIQLCLIVLGPLIIEGPYIARHGTPQMPTAPASLIALAGLFLIFLCYLANRMGHVRPSALGTIGVLCGMIWQYPFFATHKLAVVAYLMLIIPAIIADLLTSAAVTIAIMSINCIPFLVFFMLHSKTQTGEVPLPMYMAICAFMIVARRHRMHLEAMRQQELRLSRDRYRNLLESVFEAVAIERNGAIIRINPGFSRLFGCTESEALRHPLRRFLPDLPAREGMPAAGMREGLGKTWNGEDRHVQFVLRELEEESESTRIAGIRDITAERALEEKQRRMEDQMQQSQKLESLGILAGGIAHDFNNLLGAILGQASLLDMELPQDSQAHTVARSIARAAEQAAELTEKLLGFARQGKHQSAVLDIHDVLEETGVLLQHLLNKNIEVRYQTGASNPCIKGDPVQLQQVFLNLAINARDAMPDGGMLTFRTESIVVESARDDVKATPGTYVVVHVSDTGGGISPELLPRIFEPFFTTKAFGQGTGLGLSMVYGIVDTHGGFIEVHGGKGTGAVFTVYLPATDEPVSKPLRAYQDVPEPFVASGHILVVEDEPLVRNMVHTLLTRFGYETTLTENGQQGLDYYEAHWREIDLVIIDMIMPVMDGEQCYYALRAINPAAKVILSSGFGLNERAQTLLDAGVKAFVKKPYRVDELSRTVKEVLREGEERR